MSEMKSLLGSEVREGAGSCYAELLALRFFRRAVRNYTSKKIDDDLFRPLVRNIFNETCVDDLQTRLIGRASKKEDVGTTNFKDMLDRRFRSRGARSFSGTIG